MFRFALPSIAAIGFLLIAFAPEAVAQTKAPVQAKGMAFDWYKAANKAIHELRRKRQYTAALKKNAELLARVEREFGAQSFDAAIVLSVRGHIQDAQKTYQDAVATYERSLGIMRDVFGPTHAQVAVVMTSLASSTARLGEIEKAAALMQEALEIAIKADGAESKGALAVLNEFAVFNANYGDKAAAERQVEQIIALTAKINGPKSTALLRAYKKKGRYLASRKRWDDLKAFASEQLAQAEKAHGPDDTFTIQLFADFAKTYSSVGRYKPSEEFYRQVVARSERRFGAAHRFTVANYALLANTLQDQGKHAAALPFFEKAIANWVTAFGKAYYRVHDVYLRYGTSLRKRARFDDAEKSYRQAIEVSKKAYGKYHQYNSEPYLLLAGLYKELGRFGEAEKLYKRALKAARLRYGKKHSRVALTLDNMAVLYLSMGRYKDAEEHAKASLELYEEIGGIRSASLVYVLNNLATIYNASDRSDEALQYMTRALQLIAETPSLKGHPLLGVLFDNLATFYSNRGNQKLAIKYRKRGYERLLAAHGKDSAPVATAAGNLGALYSEKREFDKALPWFQQALATHEKIYGKEHRSYGSSLRGMGRVMAGLGRLDESVDYYRRAIALFEKVLPEGHPNTMWSIAYMARAMERQGKIAEAYSNFRRASNIAVERARQGRGVTASRIYRGKIRTAYKLVQSGDAGRQAELLAVSFGAAQRSGDIKVAGALAKMSARFAAKDDDLGRAIRQQQDLLDKLKTTEARLTTALGAVQEKRDDALIGRLRTESRGLRRDLAALETKLRKEFPRYAELSQPQPLSVGALQGELRSDELFVQYLGIGRDLYAWVVGPKQSSWHRLEMKGKVVRRLVNKLRCGLDATGWSDEPPGEPCEDQFESTDGFTSLPFDLHTAHDLYRGLFGPFADRIAGRRLMIVTTGALGALPFHVLVRERPEKAFVDQPGGYKRVAWLAKSNPITVLPAASSLGALRRYAGDSRAGAPYYGIGDPVLAGTDQCPAVEVPQSCGPAPKALPAQSMQVANAKPATVLRAGQANVAAVSQLCPLPDTAHELRCVAKSLGSDPAKVQLGPAANEREVKARSAKGELAQYRIVHFATHGLLPGETKAISKGLTEASLVLTPPKQATPDDDGLLTTSEIAQLRLDADWVVLSACNTASSGGPGGASLSGLARAFFYAGARAALVSHWPVSSSAAVKLTTGAFAALRANPALGRAEAMRLSMAQIIDGGEDWEAHPSYWAPFVVAGEGGGTAPIARIVAVSAPVAGEAPARAPADKPAEGPVAIATRGAGPTVKQASKPPLPARIERAQVAAPVRPAPSPRRKRVAKEPVPDWRERFLQGLD